MPNGVIFSKDFCQFSQDMKKISFIFFSIGKLPIFKNERLFICAKNLWKNSRIYVFYPIRTIFDHTIPIADNQGCMGHTDTANFLKPKCPCYKKLLFRTTPLFSFPYYFFRWMTCVFCLRF